MAEVGARVLCLLSPLKIQSSVSVGNQVARLYGMDDVADGVQHRLGLLVLDVVAALGRDHQSAAGDQVGQLALQLTPQPLFELDKRYAGIGTPWASATAASAKSGSVAAPGGSGVRWSRCRPAPAQ
jgi:hypothetical protein